MRCRFESTLSNAPFAASDFCAYLNWSNSMSIVRHPSFTPRFRPMSGNTGFKKHFSILKWVFEKSKFGAISNSGLARHAFRLPCYHTANQEKRNPSHAIEE
jgi:hypothetical protein